MKRALQGFAVLGLLALAAAPAALADDRGSVTTGATVGEGATSVHVQAAFPGLTFSLLHGFGPDVDLGAVFTLNYNYEGDVRAPFPGFKVQGHLKATVLKNDRYNLGLWFAPGMLTYSMGQTWCFPMILGTHTVDGSFYSAGNICNSFGGRQFGASLAAGVVLGIPVRDNLNFSLNLDLPLFVTFGDSGTLAVPVLSGAGVEYFVGRSTAVTFNFRTGPMIFARSGYGTDFTLQALVGLAHSFR
jgi:hypothetical protein